MILLKNQILLLEFEIFVFNECSVEIPYYLCDKIKTFDKNLGFISRCWLKKTNRFITYFEITGFHYQFRSCRPVSQMLKCPCKF